MPDQPPAWPRDVTYVHVSPEHVIRGKPGSLTESAAALAIADAIGPDVATVSVDADVITAHEKRPPFRWWTAETPLEVDDWLTAISGYGFDGEFAAAADLGLLDFELSWTEGADTAAGKAAS
jgi:hypothetical protein